MKALKIYYHDGSVQICTPDEKQFNGDWRKLAETIAGKHYHQEHAYLKHEII